MIIIFQLLKVTLNFLCLKASTQSVTNFQVSSDYIYTKPQSVVRHNDFMSFYVLLIFRTNLFISIYYFSPRLITMLSDRILLLLNHLISLNLSWFIIFHLYCVVINDSYSMRYQDTKILKCIFNILIMRIISCIYFMFFPCESMIRSCSCHFFNELIALFLILHNRRF